MSKRADPPATERALSDRAPPMSARLQVIVFAGPDQGQRVDLVPGGTYLVGKAAGCALVLSDPAVSRQHIELEVNPDGIVVRDLGSKNGTFLGGARFAEAVVGGGATIELGDTTLKIVSQPVSDPILPSSADHFGNLRGRSLRMREVFTLLERAAASDAMVLIEGETGTGKEVAAEALHHHSARARQPFVVCDLGAVPHGLIGSELFGHKRGAFSGAAADRAGAFAAAAGGTILLDEIGELQLELQAQLLRVVADRQVKPVGGSVHSTIDVRVIAATNRNLAEEVRAGRFRDDLYHRLAVVRVRLPPLRERREDILHLVDHFLSGTGITVAPEAQALLREYDWPGNVRELKNVIERSQSMIGKGRIITPAALGFHSAGDAPCDTESDTYRATKERLLAFWEKEFVGGLLRRTNGNVAQAARTGGIDRVYLHRLMKKHGIGKKR